MNVLTATSSGQGGRENDFSWTVEGELVCLGLVCAKDQRDPDGGCGCGRAFSGMSSHRPTTTAMVRDLPLSRDDVCRALAGYVESAGYGTFALAELGDEVEELKRLAANIPVGTVVGRRLDHLEVRGAGTPP